MRIGVPKEIKPQEFRVGLTPAGARELIAEGHEVYVETNAGAGIGYSDASYLTVGCEIISTAEELFSTATLIIKVKEPQPKECRLLRSHHILFTFLHLAPDPEQAKLLQQSGATCIAYETVADDKGALPLLAPMSEVAGRLSVQAAARCLEKNMGGKGILMGGVPGVRPANVLVIGGGVVGVNAARMAAGLGAKVTIVDKSIARLKTIDDLFHSTISTRFSTLETVEELLIDADVVIGAVLVPGASAPKVVRQSQLTLMQPGSVLVDVAIDQGGCFETSKPTTHENPIFSVENITHYCVANMPGAVALTSTLALTNATLPFVMQLAKSGEKALEENAMLLSGLNVMNGKITHAAVAEALAEQYFPPQQVLNTRWAKSA